MREYVCMEECVCVVCAQVCEVRGCEFVCGVCARGVRVH